MALLVVMTLIGASHAFATNHHIAITFFVAKGGHDHDHNFFGPSINSWSQGGIGNGGSIPVEVAM